MDLGVVYRTIREVVAKVAGMAPNFPDIIERTLVYPSYTFELMFGATGGDFCHGRHH